MVGPFQIRCQTTVPFESLTMNIRVAGWPNGRRQSCPSSRRGTPAVGGGGDSGSDFCSSPAPGRLVEQGLPVRRPFCKCQQGQTQAANSAFPTATPFGRAGEGLHVCVMAFLLF